MGNLLQSDLKKKAIIFSLDDVLIPGKVDSEIDFQAVKEILSNLQKLENELEFHLIGVSSQTKNLTKQKISEIKDFFKTENLFFVSKEYINSKEEVDKERHSKALIENPEFKDEYFKQIVINQTMQKYGLQKEDLVLVGHEIWNDAYYTYKFSKIDFALMEESFSEREKNKSEKIPGLIYVKRNWNSIKDLITGKLTKPNYSEFDAYCFEAMKDLLIKGTKLEDYDKKAS